MTVKYIVDTHALIWFLEGNSRLGERARAILSNADSRLVLPAIALAEAAWIVERGKTTIPSVEALLNAIAGDLRISVYPLDQAVVECSTVLSAVNEMHDRQIVATVLVLQSQSEEAVLLTCDQNITASKLVPIVW
jgi:PIN domain nuclease of toxin-antitoxin system